MSQNKDAKLLAAAAKGDYDAVDALLKEGASPNCRDDSGLTPLHLAAAKGYTDTVYRLLEENFDAEGNELPKDKKKLDETAKDIDGNTALHLAAKGSWVAAARLLLKDSDIEIDAVNREGKSALDYAIDKDHHNMVEVLLRENASVSPLQFVRASHTVRAMMEKETKRRFKASRG